MWGTFLEESSPHPSKNLNKWFVGEDIILPKIMPLCRETGDTRDSGKPSFGEGFPEPFRRTCRKAVEVMPCLAAFCLWQNFGGFLPRTRGYASIPSSSSGKTLRNFPPRGKILFRDKGQKLFDLKVALTYRANIRANLTRIATYKIRMKKLHGIGNQWSPILEK